MQYENNQQTYDAGAALRWNGHLTKMPMPKGKAQRVGTQKNIVDYVADYFGYLVNVLGVPHNDCSLAQVACVEAIETFLQFKRDSKPDELEEDRVLSKHDVKILLTFDQILDLLAQDISFRDKLKPIPGHLTADNAQFIQQFWNDHIHRASETVQRLYENEIKQCKKRFDNEAAIRRILDSKRPLAILHDMRRAAQRAVARAPTKFARAAALRDLFIVAVMMMLCAFRPKTPCHLDWRVDGASSCFRYTDVDGKEGWWIFAEKEFFKNFDQPIMQRDYLRMIQDIDGLYDHVEEYLFEARAVLLDGAESDCLLVNTSTNPRFTPDSYADHVRYLTRRLLTVDLAGKWNITSLTCTQVRKILATGLNKKYKDPLYAEVKNALMNQVPFIYSHDSARDRSRSTEEILMETKDQ